MRTSLLSVKVHDFTEQPRRQDWELGEYEADLAKLLDRAVGLAWNEKLAMLTPPRPLSTVAQARVEMTTGRGREYCPRISVARFDALGRSVPGPDVLCHDLPAKAQVRGLLGLNFLRHFDLRINFKQGFITLR
jgi:hypothetical protein